MITWKEEFSVGVEALDQQHKDLFHYFNDLDGIIQDRDVSKQKLRFALQFLEKYAANHFSHEESCMHKHSCPVAGKNKMAHEKFIEAYNILEYKFNQNDDSFAILKELHSFLESWLVEHIFKIDTRLKPCVHKETAQDPS